MKKDRAVGLILILAAIAVAVGTANMKVSTQNVAGDPGPQIMPYFTAVLLGLCGIGIFLNAKPSEKTMTKVGWIHCFGIIAICLVYVLLLEPLGFLISTGAALTALLCWIAYSREGKETVHPIAFLIYAAVVTVLMYLFFTRVLNIILPKGILSF